MRKCSSISGLWHHSKSLPFYGLLQLIVQLYIGFEMQEQHCFCAWSSCCEKIHHCLIYASYVWTKFDKFWQWQILNLELYRAHTLHACTSAMYSRCSNSCTHDPITLHRCTDTYISLWTWRPFPTSSLSMCGWGRTWHKWVWSKGVADRYKPFNSTCASFQASRRLKKVSFLTFLML